MTALLWGGTVTATEYILFVQLDPITELKGDGMGSSEVELVPTVPMIDPAYDWIFDAAEQNGINEPVVDALRMYLRNYNGGDWSIVPFFSKAKVFTKPLSGAEPIGGNCEGQYFCAFSISQSDAALISENGVIKFGLSDGGVFQKRTLDFIGGGYFKTSACKSNTRCPLLTGLTDRVVGEVVLLEINAETDCLLSDSTYLAALLSQVNIAQKMMSSQPEKFTAFNAHEIFMDVSSATINLKTIAGTCTPALELKNLIRLSQPVRQNDQFMLFSATAFYFAGLFSNDSFFIKYKQNFATKKTKVKLEKVRDTSGQVRKLEVVLDYGELLGNLKDTYEQSGKILFRTDSRNYIDAMNNTQGYLFGSARNSVVSMPKGIAACKSVLASKYRSEVRAGACSDL
ncbi:hypothetical protein AAIM60_22505 [Pseudomonas lijiangensis]|uniref:hypothetical protein n=1 Tax=Pseudomonas lijiangensis TaxID=2995658 RepID=UPI0031BAA6C2